MRRAGVVLAVAGVFAAAGCGSDDPTGTVVAFYRAIGERDPDAACAQLATDGRPLQETDLLLCVTGLRQAMDTALNDADAQALRTASVTGAQVDGDHATVHADQLSGVPDGYRDEVSLVRVSGRWYIVSDS